MNRLNDILASGRAPGLVLKVPDPTSADVAVPRALKQLEQTQSADSIVREMGWKATRRNLKEIKKTWNL